MVHHSNVIIKVYGHIWPSTATLVQSLEPLMPHSEFDDEILNHENDLTRLSYEGIYFPIDDVIAIIHSFLNEKSQGKIDYIDLEAWTLTRHSIQGKSINITSRSLNDVMDYSGH